MLPDNAVLDLGKSDSPLRIILRPLITRDDYAQCRSLQLSIFGPPEIASAILIKSCHEVGGLAAGAFNSDGEMLGCTVGVSGMRDGHPAHWSSLTAVKSSAYGLGIGRRLKLYSRGYLLSLGIRSVYSTFDPLAARTAHFNLNRLGSRPIAYQTDFYAESSSNDISTPYDHDRLLVRWVLDAPHVEQLAAGDDRPVVPAAWQTAITVNVDPQGRPLDVVSVPEGAGELRIEIPWDLRRRDEPDEARAWRRCVRQGLAGALALGYAFAGFLRTDGRCFYVLERGR